MPGSDTAVSVAVYGRPGCHLCDEAVELLNEIRRSGIRFEVVEVNIERSEELHASYLERIPVIQVNGDEVAELDVSKADLEMAIVRAASMLGADDD